MQMEYLCLSPATKRIHSHLRQVCLSYQSHICYARCFEGPKHTLLQQFCGNGENHHLFIPQEFRDTLIGEDMLVVMAGVQSVEWY